MKSQDVVKILSISLLTIIVYLSIIFFIRLYNFKNTNYTQNEARLNFEASSCVSKEWKPLAFFEKGEREFLISGLL